jgi:hypothetical protein
MGCSRDLRKVFVAALAWIGLCPCEGSALRLSRSRRGKRAQRLRLPRYRARGRGSLRRDGTPQPDPRATPDPSRCSRRQRAVRPSMEHNQGHTPARSAARGTRRCRILTRGNWHHSSSARPLATKRSSSDCSTTTTYRTTRSRDLKESTRPGIAANAKVSASRLVRAPGRPLCVSAERRWRRLLAGVRTSRPRSRMLGAPRSEQYVNLTRPSKLGAIMIFRSYESALEYTPTQAKRLVVAPMVRSMFGCVSGSAIGRPHQLESQSPCPLPAFVAAAAALTSASVNQ